MKNDISSIVRELICHMGDHQLETEKDLILDGETHTDWAYVNGEHKLVVYTAIWYPFGKKNYPPLICCYGLINDKTQYTYPSPE